MHGCWDFTVIFNVKARDNWLLKINCTGQLCGGLVDNKNKHLTCVCTYRLMQIYQIALIIVTPSPCIASHIELHQTHQNVPLHALYFRVPQMRKGRCLMYQHQTIPCISLMTPYPGAIILLFMKMCYREWLALFGSALQLFVHNHDVSCPCWEHHIT